MKPFIRKTIGVVYTLLFVVTVFVAYSMPPMATVGGAQQVVWGNVLFYLFPLCFLISGMVGFVGYSNKKAEKILLVLPLLPLCVFVLIGIVFGTIFSISCYVFNLCG